MTFPPLWVSRAAMHLLLGSESLILLFLFQLSQGSPEPIEPSFFTADYHLLHHSLGGNSLSSNDPTGNNLQHRKSGFQEEIGYLDQQLSLKGYIQLKMKRELILIICGDSWKGHTVGI